MYCLRSWFSLSGGTCRNEYNLAYNSSNNFFSLATDQSMPLDAATVIKYTGQDNTQ